MFQELERFGEKFETTNFRGCDVLIQNKDKTASPAFIKNFIRHRRTVDGTSVSHSLAVLSFYAKDGCHLRFPVELQAVKKTVEFHVVPVQLILAPCLLFPVKGFRVTNPYARAE